VSGFALVDVHDAAQFAPWFALHDRAGRLASGEDEGWLEEEWRARAGDDSAPIHDRLYRLGPLDAPLGVANAEYNDYDNRHLARAELYVDPPWRRRALGTALLGALEDEIRSRGRSTLAVRVLVAPQGGAGAAARGFAAARGYRHAATAVRRAWPLPRPPAELDALEARWRARAGTYRIISSVGPTPEEHLGERARLCGLIATAVPDAGVRAEPERWDAARVRELEAHAEALGRHLVVALACDPSSGRPVGYSEVSVSRRAPSSAYQWGTLVEPAHRGRGLAGLMKCAAVRALSEVSPATRRVVTENDARNTAVIAMNEALGFRVVGEHLTFVRDL
jgi:RimJ/RimL family protein N-acetyltransferase